MSENKEPNVADETENKELSNAENPETSEPKIESEEDLKKRMSRYSRRNFLGLGIGAIGAIAGWEWIKSRPEIGGIPSPLRNAHQFNEALSQSFYSPQRLAPTFSVAEAKMPRVNGNEGIDDDFDPAKWKLQIVGVFEPQKHAQFVSDVYYDYEPDETEDSEEESDESTDTETKKETSEPETEETPDPDIPGLLLTLDDIKALPRFEMVTELKCIEGWSEKVYWAGARLSDFIAKFAPPTRDGSPPDVINNPQNLVRYISLETPGEGYYVGLDMASAMHPQTLLCYEMNGAPLTLQHGAPLRLVTPLKYGIKHIKRIGRITFTDERPKDFWAEQGYDWYSGH